MAGGLPANLMALLQNSMGPSFMSGQGVNPFANLNQGQGTPPAAISPVGAPPAMIPPANPFTSQPDIASAAQNAMVPPVITPPAGGSPFPAGAANQPGATAPANPMGGNAMQALLQLLAQHRGAASQAPMAAPGMPPAAPQMGQLPPNPQAIPQPMPHPSMVGPGPMQQPQQFNRSPITLGNQPMQPAMNGMQMNGQGPAMPNLPPQIYAMLAQQLKGMGQF